MTPVAPPGAVRGAALGALLLLLQDLIPWWVTGWFGPPAQLECASALALIGLAAAPLLALGESCRRLTRRSTPPDGKVPPGIAASAVALVLMAGIPLSVAVYNGAQYVVPWGLPLPAGGAAGIPYAEVRAFGLPLLGALACLKGAFDGMAHPRYAVAALAAGTVASAVFATALSAGSWGAPSLGIAGAAAGAVLGQGISVLVLGLFAVLAGDLRRKRFLWPRPVDPAPLGDLVRGAGAPLVGSAAMGGVLLAAAALAGTRGVAGLAWLVALSWGLLCLAVPAGAWRAFPGLQAGPRRWSWGVGAALALPAVAAPALCLALVSRDVVVSLRAAEPLRGTGAVVLAGALLALWRVRRATGRGPFDSAAGIP